jgi:hypothetical protein
MCRAKIIDNLPSRPIHRRDGNIPFPDPAQAG